VSSSHTAVASFLLNSCIWNASIAQRYTTFFIGLVTDDEGHVKSDVTQPYDSQWRGLSACHFTGRLCFGIHLVI